LADERAKELVKRWRSLREGMGHYYQHCEDLARVLLPGRIGFTSQVHDGDRRSEDIYDGTGMQAARSLANAVDGMLWPEGQQSFFIEAVDDDIKDDPDVRAWCSDCEDKMEAAFDNPRARFRQSRGEANLDLVTFGGAHLFMGESTNLRNLLFQTLHPKDAVVMFDDEGNANGLFRSRKMTVRQAAARFGENKLSEKLRKKITDKKFDDMAEFLHAVVLREEVPHGARLFGKNLPYADLWMEVDECYTVQEGGYHEFPFACPRWDTSSGETTGRSPGMIALPDANTLQAMEETLLIAGQRAADPPLMAPNDGAFDAANTFPGGITYYDVELAKSLGTIPVAPLESGANMPIVLEMQDKKREQVWAAFLRNILNLPVDGPQMTATEIIQRREEIIREVGPVFGRLDTDYKAPLVERPFMVMLRAGQFAPVPNLLAGRSIKFRYSSPIKRIRQQIEAAAAAAFVREMGEMVKMTGDPSHMDVVNVEAYSRVQAEANNVPRQIVNTPEVVAQKRQARQQQAEAMQKAEMAKTVAEAANKGAGALKQVMPQTEAA
jgi:hypothetical protein